MIIKNKKTKKDDSIIILSKSTDKYYVKAKLISDEEFEKNLNDLMSSELVYGDDNYY